MIWQSCKKLSFELWGACDRFGDYLCLENDNVLCVSGHNQFKSTPKFTRSNANISKFSRDWQEVQEIEGHFRIASVSWLPQMTWAKWNRWENWGLQFRARVWSVGHCVLICGTNTAGRRCIFGWGRKIDPSLYFIFSSDLAEGGTGRLHRLHYFETPLAFIYSSYRILSHLGRILMVIDPCLDGLMVRALLLSMASVIATRLLAT